MTAPRRPFGTELPGRLPSTVMKVLAAEISDPERLRRGKAYAKQDAVVDIDVAPGIVTCEVQGSRSTPYVVTLQVAPGEGLPMARDLLARCSCPDEDWASVCKHVVTTMFTLADEFLIEPELLEVWRGNPRTRSTPSDGESGEQAERREPTDRSRRHLRVVRPGDGAAGATAEPDTAPEPVVDPLAAALRPPDGSTIPSQDDLALLDAPTPPRASTRSPRLDDLLDEARARLRLDWD